MKNKVNKIIKILIREFPNNKNSQSSTGALDVLIATMLSQNTTDKTSYRAFMNLKTGFSGWEDVMNSPASKIKKAIRVCGLSNQKSKNIKELLESLNISKGKLSLDYIKKLSDDKIYEDLLQYNGVGVKTISCVLAFSLKRDVFPVDTHVHRISNRLGLVKTKTPDKTFSLMNEIIPEGKKFLLHTLFIRFGRKICKSQNPLCSKCVLYEECEFSEKEYYFNRSLKSETVIKVNDFIIMEHI